MFCFFLHSQFLRCLIKEVPERFVARDFFDYAFYTKKPVIVNITPNTLKIFEENFSKEKDNRLEEWMQKFFAFGINVCGSSIYKTEQEAIVVNALRTKKAEKIFIVVKDESQRTEINQTFKREDVYPDLQAITIPELKGLMLGDSDYCQIMKKAVEPHN